MLKYNEELIRKILQPLRNRDDLYLLPELCHGILVTAESFVRSQFIRHLPKGGLVLLKDLLRKLAVFNLFLHHGILGYKLFLRLTQQDLMTKLHGFAPPAAFDQLGVFFKKAEDPLFRGNHFPVNPHPLCNMEYRSYAAKVALHLGSEVGMHFVRPLGNHLHVLRRNL